MIIINTTFVVDTAIYDQWIEWLKSDYIATALTSKLDDPRLMKIVAETEPGVANYALQLHAPSIDTLEHWLQTTQPGLLASMTRLFADKALHFTTLMQPVEI